jgi:predicted nuclease of predicted toxin-antitoxin system
MPRTIRFHLDENCHRAIADGLRRRGIDVTTPSEVGLLSATDEEQAAYGLRSGRAVVTQDRDFLCLHATPDVDPAIGAGPVSATAHA